MTNTAEEWTGHWRWRSDTAVFTNPHHENVWREQTQEVRVEGQALFMKTRQVFMDGSVRSWTWDGAFDGQPRPIIWDDDGSTMATIAFVLVDNGLAGDVYRSADGAFTGAEYLTIEEDRVRVWGSSTSEGRQYTYFEEWERDNQATGRNRS